MLKVGSSVVNKIHRKKEKLSYADIEYDSDKWADASKYLPKDFDLLYLKIVGTDKIFVGWVYSKKWDGLKLKGNEKILYWKRKL